MQEILHGQTFHSVKTGNRMRKFALTAALEVLFVVCIVPNYTLLIWDKLLKIWKSREYTKWEEKLKKSLNSWNKAEKG